MQFEVTYIKYKRMAELCVKCIFEEFVYVYTHLMLNLIALELVNKIVIKVLCW